MPKDLQGRTCRLCGKPHKNRSNNLCNHCRSKEFKFGKYYGQTIDEVSRDIDGKKYLNWMYFDGYQSCQNFLIDNDYCPIMTSGKYINKCFDEILELDPEYCRSPEKNISDKDRQYLSRYINGT